MANYPDELEELCFSAEQKQALLRRLLAGRPAAEQRRMRPPYRGLVAAVAVISLLAGAVGAVSLAGVSPAFRALFGVTNEEQAEQLGAEQLNLVYTDKNGSGASITVKEVAEDQEHIYILMDFSAPEGVTLPWAERAENGASYWLYGDEETGALGMRFSSDEAGAHPVWMNGYGLGFGYVEDTDPTDHVVPLLLTVTLDQPRPEEARWFTVSQVCTLWSMRNGEAEAVLEGLDIPLAIPVETAQETYSFQGRSPVKLGGVAMAVAENLVLSPVSVTMDLVLPDGAAYDALFAEYGPWEVYVLLADGTRVSTQFEKAGGVQHVYRDETGAEFFRADHVRFVLEYPIDVGLVDDIVFVGDNSRSHDGLEHTGEVVYFRFSPQDFVNHTYWNEINWRWRLDGTGQPDRSAGLPEAATSPAG